MNQPSGGKFPVNMQGIKTGILTVMVMALMAAAQAQPTPAINRIEYYVDADPGYGNATSLSFTGTTDANGTIQLDLSPLGQGVHVIGIRSRDVNGAWSLDNKWIFLKPYSGAGAAPVPNINRVEYYIDNDPGYGNAAPLSIPAGNDLSGLAISIDMAALGQGVHVVGIRSRDANGAWSLDNKWIFLKPYNNTGIIPVPNINRVEYFIDNDPGYGNATPLSIPAGNDLAGLAISIDVAALGQGVHVVGVRSRDANGAWSIDNKWIFLKPYSNGAVPVPNINRVEYFIDNDPGYGNATPLSFTPGTDLSNLLINIDVAALGQGVHIAGIRSRDVNGAWSLDNKWIFLKPYSNGALPVPRIVRMEYFIDSDPGYGNATPVTITAATDISSLVFEADISVVPNGSHKLGIRSLDENGAWSLDNEVAFTGGTLVSNVYQWTGNASTSWTNPANWSTGIVPAAANDVLIPAGRPFYPVIASGVQANCRSIKVDPTATVTVATGGSLKVNQ